MTKEAGPKLHLLRGQPIENTLTIYRTSATPQSASLLTKQMIFYAAAVAIKPC